MFSITAWKTKVARGLPAFLSENDKEAKQGNRHRELRTKVGMDQDAAEQHPGALKHSEEEHLPPLHSRVLERRSVFQETERRGFLAMRTLSGAGLCSPSRAGHDLQLICVHR